MKPYREPLEQAPPLIWEILSNGDLKISLVEDGPFPYRLKELQHLLRSKPYSIYGLENWLYRQLQDDELVYMSGPDQTVVPCYGGSVIYDFANNRLWLEPNYVFEALFEDMVAQGYCIWTKVDLGWEIPDDSTLLETEADLD